MVLSFFEAPLETGYTVYSNKVVRQTDQATSMVMLLTAVACAPRMIRSGAPWQVAVFLACCSTPLLPLLAKAWSPKSYLLHREWFVSVPRVGLVGVGILWDHVLYRSPELTISWGAFGTNILLLGGQWFQLLLFSLFWQVRLKIHVPLQLLCATLLVCSYPYKLEWLYQHPGTMEKLQSLHQAARRAARMLPIPTRAVQLLDAITTPEGFVLHWYVILMVVLGVVVPLRMLWKKEMQRRRQFLAQIATNAPIESVAAHLLPIYILLSVQTVYMWWSIDAASIART